MVKILCAMLRLWCFGGLVGISSCWRCSGPFTPPPRPLRPMMTPIGSMNPRVAIGREHRRRLLGRRRLPGVLSSADCIEDCTPVSSSEGDTIRVGALLECSLLDCIEDCASVPSSEGDTIRVWALLEWSLLDWSSSELFGSVSNSDSECWGCRMRGTVSATSAE